LADSVAILNQGRIEQIGTPRSVGARPASSFVQDFLSDMNVAASNVRDLRSRKKFMGAEG
jgi:ABC-type Fe3+/spermidine/putrescine transport system ATPase subunit